MPTAAPTAALCLALAALLVLTGLLWAAFQAYAREKWEARSRLAALRRGMLRSRALRSDAPGAYAALREWTLAPSDSLSRAEVADRTIFLVVAADGVPFDEATLRHVLCHELAHAARGDGEHDGAFFEEMQRAVRALEKDGLLPPGFRPDPTYPADILADE